MNFFVYKHKTAENATSNGKRVRLCHDKVTADKSCFMLHLRNAFRKDTLVPL